MKTLQKSILAFEPVQLDSQQQLQVKGGEDLAKQKAMQDLNEQ